eukprot:TRINITY_DN5637_c0_g2_i2.p1 TRINITY_DN5637_c0_g2~~TRINITY_DN5637_c0_g2_i2.p1  ORF type:complete len:157 (-),score=18.23 TRINITY_DN5637_c0_g2_i2:131-601(-)
MEKVFTVGVILLALFSFSDARKCETFTPTRDCVGIFPNNVANVTGTLFLKTADSTALKAYSNNPNVTKNQACQAAFVTNQCLLFTDACFGNTMGKACFSVCVNLLIKCESASLVTAIRACNILSGSLYANQFERNCIGKYISYGGGSTSSPMSTSG